MPKYGTVEKTSDSEVGVVNAINEFIYKQPVSRVSNTETNKLLPEDRPAHDWYRFVLSFPPHLVRQYIERFGIQPGQCVLDPFCGTGTTVVECKKLGLNSIGTEANPIAHYAGQVKLNWSPDPDGLIEHAEKIEQLAEERLRQEGIIEDKPILALERKVGMLRELPEASGKLLLTNSISPLPLHKTLILLDCLEECREEQYYHHERVALAKALVTRIGNLHFGPEVGVGPAKADAPVVSAWMSNIRSMAGDIKSLQALNETAATIHNTDARNVAQVIAPQSVDAVITSPPYPNEKDYTRTTRLESVLLGFLSSRDELRQLKRGLVRSNTRGVYKGDDDDVFVAGHAEINRIADAIESRRIELGKTSGFERMYARVTKLYFGGMARHLSELRTVLKPGAHLAYVVGDQASYLRVMIRTGQLLADIAESLGYEVVGIDLFRTRIASATKEQLREEVVVLRWTGSQ